MLDRLAGLRAPASVDIDGCEYREGLQAVRITGGVAGNVVPDECVVTVNFRFAPDRSVDAAAAARAARCSTGFELTRDRRRARRAARPRRARRRRSSSRPPVATARAKFGWTDVARFAALGIPALNYGPGDPNLAHTREEHVDTAADHRATDVLRRS